MDWLSTVDWTAVGLGAGALAFALLVGRAVARMRRGRDYGDELPEPKERPDNKKTSPDGTKKAAKAKRKPEQRPETSAASKTTDDALAERERLARGLERTRGGFVARLGSLFGGKAGFDETLLEQVEEVLFGADIGVKTSQELIDGIRRELAKKEQTDASAVWAYLKQKSAAMIERAGTRALEPASATPFVILVVGVNGTGKTTTIGKLAARLGRDGSKVLLAAGDTFRAAAANQLRVWGDRSEAAVVSGKEGADPASVIVEALKRAQAEDYDLVIADTAGRLHTQSSLMDELSKVKRAIGKYAPGAPHETLLVLDATTGQNAITQAQMFRQATDVSGLVLTKLDGTAKGGVLLGICNELQLPVMFIGIGEKVDDLRVFDPDAFVDALYESSATAETVVTPNAATSG